MRCLPCSLRNYTSAGVSSMCRPVTVQTLNVGNRSGYKYSCMCCMLNVALRSKWRQNIRESVTSSLMTDWIQPSVLSTSYNHFWRCANHVFAEFLWWVLVDVLAVHGEQCSVCLPEYRGCKSHCIQNVCRRIKAPPRRSVLLLNIVLRNMFLPGRLNIVCSISLCSRVRSSKHVVWHLSCLYGRCFNPLLKK
jgi:hypothetical protein